MKRLLWGAFALAAATCATGSAAAPAPQVRLAQPRTLASTHSPIKQFAQDGNWVAWTTVGKICTARMHVLSLRTHRLVEIRQSGYSVTCGDYGDLALAGDRLMWETLTGAGNTELDIAVETASARAPKPRRVREMAIARDASGPEPLVPPLAGRSGLLVFYRHEDGILGSPTHAVERVSGRRVKRVFREDDPVALAVDRGRIAAARRQLVRGDACNCNFDPVWSPDGTKVAFISGQNCCVDDDETSDVYVMNSDGTGRTRVTTDALPKLGIAWSPDGARLAFGYYTSSFALKVAIVNADGSGRHDVANGRYPAWSPDGTKLAFEDGTNHVDVGSVDGSNVQQVATGSRPAWSPDGLRLAYDDGVGAVFSSRADGSDKHRVADGLREPAWSPDGTLIAGSAQNGIWIVPASGGGHQVLAGTQRGDGDSSWSPDGQKILFDSLRNDLNGDVYAQPEVYMTDAAGGNAQPLTYTRPDEWSSPLQVRSLYGRTISSPTASGAPLGVALAGRFVAALTRAAHTGHEQVEVFDASSGKLLRMLAAPANAAGPVSASGSRLVFSAGRTVRLVNLASGGVQVLAFAGGPVVGVAISGRRVTWAENDGKHGRIRSLLLPR